MKFAKLLRVTSEHLPELQGLLQCYKTLKKVLKSSAVSTELAGEERAVADAEIERKFVEQLDSYLDSFNNKWLEQEEIGTIRLHAMESRVATASSAEQRLALRKELLDFHGETLLMMHSSIMMYTGLVKILKKYHKRTGLLINAAHLKNLLSQPFCSTELVSNMVTQVEALLEQLGEQPAASVEGASVSVEPQRQSPSGRAAHGEGGASTIGGGSPTGPGNGSVVGGRDGSARSRDGEASEQGAEAQPSRSVSLTSIFTARDTLPAASVSFATAADEPPALRASGDSRRAATDASMVADSATAGPSGGAAADLGVPPHARLLGLALEADAAAAEGAAGEDEADDVLTSLTSISSDESDSELAHMMGGEEGTINPAHANLPVICQQTRLALSTWRHLLNNSTTPSTVLPPSKRARSDRATSLQGHHAPDHRAA